jgi:hypothetical protein
VKVRNQFPSYATKNCDFVTGQRKEGRILDLQIDVETLPAVGMLCVHENTVKVMVTKLGWKLEKENELETALTQVEILKEELSYMQDIVAKMQLAGYEQASPSNKPERSTDVLVDVE